MTDIAPQPIRRWFGTPTAIHVSLLSPEARARVSATNYIERHALRDQLGGQDWRGEWETAVARGKAHEAKVITERATELAEAVAPQRGGRLLRGAIDATSRVSKAVTSRLGLAESGSGYANAAIGAALSTPVKKSGVLSDVAFSTVTNVAEAALRGGKLTDAEATVDTGTAITYDVTTGTAAGVVGTLVGAVATPPVGITAAIATKRGIDAMRDVVVWRAAEMMAGARASLTRSDPPSPGARRE